MNSSGRLRAGVIALCTLASCAPTTYDASIATSTSIAPTTTEPEGTVEELLGRLSVAMSSLSGYIGPDQSGRTPSGKNEQLGLIESLWSVVREVVLADDSDAGESLERMVALARTAVERNRPADADKAARFAGQVIDDYLGRST